jgi:hypothetical protein
LRSRIRLVRNGTAIKNLYPYNKDRAPQTYTTQTEVFEESNAYGLGSMPGDTLLFEYNIGGTGGHALYITSFSATLGHVDCSGMYCSSTSGGTVNKCTARPTKLCQDTTGFAANNAAADCLCGNAVCTSVTGKFCIAERNTCYTGKLPEKPKEVLVLVDGSNELQIKIQPSDQSSSITHYNVNRYIAHETTKTSWEASELACASLGSTVGADAVSHVFKFKGECSGTELRMYEGSANPANTDNKGSFDEQRAACGKACIDKKTPLNSESWSGFTLEGYIIKNDGSGRCFCEGVKSSEPECNRYGTTLSPAYQRYDIVSTCHLVSIHSQQENEIVKNTISLSYSNYYWFGLVRLVTC